MLEHRLLPFFFYIQFDTEYLIVEAFRLFGGGGSNRRECLYRLGF